MKIKHYTRTKKGVNCYGEKNTAKYTHHDYMDGNKIVCAVVEHKVYGETVYSFLYPWSMDNDQESVHIMCKEFETLGKATEYAETYYIPKQYESNPNRLYIKAI